MAIEGATHINDLNVAKPSGATEQVLTLDDYHRQIKEVLKRDVNNFAGTALVYGADAANTDNYAFSSALTITTYTVGITCLLNVTNASTGASTLNIDGVGVKTIVNAKGVAISAGEIAAGLNVLTYDGTNFILSSYSTDPSLVTLTGTQALSNKTLTDPVINVDGTDAEGDIYYRNGSGVFSLLALGTALQKLSVNAGETAPEWTAAKEWVYLETFNTTGGGVKTLGETTAIPAGAIGIRLVVNAVNSTSSADDICFDISNSGTYNSTYVGFTTDIDGSPTTVSWATSTEPTMSTSHSALYGIVELFKEDATNVWIVSGTLSDQGGVHQSNGQITPAGEIDRIKVFILPAATGDFDAGSTIDVYYYL